MSQSEQKQVCLTTQAFLILCRLFDNCYDELTKQEEVQTVVEEIAEALLAGVSYLKALPNPPHTVEIELSFPQRYFLQKLIHMSLPLVDEAGDPDAHRWLSECLDVLQSN